MQARFQKLDQNFKNSSKISKTQAKFVQKLKKLARKLKVPEDSTTPHSGKNAQKKSLV